MIVPMRKIYLAARQRDRDQLIEILREMSILQLVPVDPELAKPEEEVIRQVNSIKSGLQILSNFEPRGTMPELSPSEAVCEVNEIQRLSAEGRNQLTALHQELGQTSVWDGLQMSYLEELRQIGMEVQVFIVPRDSIDQVHGECIAILEESYGKGSLVAVAARADQISVPDDAELLKPPARDATQIREEAKELDESLHRNVERLHQLALLAPALELELLNHQQKVDETVAVRGALPDEKLFAIQGWLPEENLALLNEQLVYHQIPVALEQREPAHGEQPPTLIRQPAWVRPIDGLFNILGTVPGYREFDISMPFLIALPIFTAMLISDGGYGALLMLVPALAYSWLVRQIGKRFTQLLIVVGAVSLIWGVLTNAFFGFQLLPFTLIPIELTDQSRYFMMQLSFVIGAIHLSLAQLLQALRYFPDLRCLNRIGWAVFIWGMYGVVGTFVLQGAFGWSTPWPYLLIVGATLAIGFYEPSRNIVRTVGMGLAQFPLSMLSAFSDVISYVRLMAVGLASSVLAISFNNMALESEHWPLTVLILLLGHSLNFCLGLIAMFAHGVRLNMLEFSSNLGMQWTGYPYKPFARRTA